MENLIHLFVQYFVDCLSNQNQSLNIICLNCNNEKNIESEDDCKNECKENSWKWQWSSYNKIESQCFCLPYVNEGMYFKTSDKVNSNVNC